jgi:hypothetical protein
MKTISTHVEEHMREYPFLSKFLRQGIVNYKALARFIEPDISKRIGVKVSVGAIAVSLQRLHYRDKDKLVNLIGRLRGVKVISNISVFSTQDREAAYAAAARLHRDKSLEKPFATLFIGDEETLVLAEKFAAEAFHGPAFHKEEIKLTALVVTREVFEDEQAEVGGLSYPLQVLAEHGVLIRAVTATFNEEIIAVEEAVADRAASILRHAMWR